MGNYFLSGHSKQHTTKLYNTLLDTDEDFLIAIDCYTNLTLTEEQLRGIVNYLQYTKPVLTYAHRTTIYLLYQPSKQSVFLRSNVLSEIVSYLSSELTIQLMRNSIEPRMINICVSSGAYEVLLDNLKKIITRDKYLGVIYDVEKISEEYLSKL